MMQWRQYIKISKIRHDNDEAMFSNFIAGIYSLFGNCYSAAGKSIYHVKPTDKEGCYSGLPW